MYYPRHSKSENEMNLWGLIIINYKKYKNKPKSFHVECPNYPRYSKNENEMNLWGLIIINYKYNTLQYFLNFKP